jgi:HAD superfamily hydrolase (TIGR01484 family)
MKLAHSDISRLAGIRILFTDIDDTMSTDGLITKAAYDALWRAHDASLDVVPVTGRPAGWCDHIARMWPVPGVVGENGGLYFSMNSDGMRKVFMHDDSTRREFRDRLEVIREDVLASVPGCAISSDQSYREYDLAVEYCEDVAPLPKEDVTRIVAIFEKHGAHAKVSSVHVNGWFGDFDKLTMAKRFAMEIMDIDVESDRGSVAFSGDSPNDEPMFAYFPLSFGVANVREFTDDMENNPAFISEASHGAGFAEIVDAIISARAGA